MMTAGPEKEEHWRWRYAMAEAIASALDAERFGVKAFYLLGSTKNATAGPGSDIDLLIHIEEDGRKTEALSLWLDGWSRCLGTINTLKTGIETESLLDIHYVTDDDIMNKTSYAVKIDAVTDAARRLETGGAND